MLRTKKDVDRHVRDILSKIKTDAERKQRGYNIARFYYNVGEYDLARRYIAEFLSARPKAIDAHRLLGEIYEASGNKEKAVLAYKTAYEMGDGQKDLLLKICEMYCTVPCDASVKMYWAQIGMRLCPHNEVVTKLRSAIISTSKSSTSRESLEQLYLDEIKVNPTSAEIQSNLVKLYLDWSEDDASKLDQAYNYMVHVEARKAFTHSLVWYQTVVQVAEAYEKRVTDQTATSSKFLSTYIVGLERLVQLTLEAVTTPGSDVNKAKEPYLTQATNLLTKLDIKMGVMKKKGGAHKELEQAMAGQLFFHLAQFLMITAKKWSTPLSPNTVPCLLLHSSRYAAPSTSVQGEMSYFHRLACYRLSQSSHILRNIAKDTNTTLTTLVNKVRQQCSNKETQDEIFKAVFGIRSNKDNSYFLHHSDFVGADFSLPDMDNVHVYDEVVSMSEGCQLREMVWLCLQQILNASSSSSGSSLPPLSLLNTSTPGPASNPITAAVKAALKGAQPYYPFKMFEGLQFGSSHVDGAVPDSLCHLDLLAFLSATVFSQLDSGACSSNVRSAVCTASVCSSWLLHTEEQGDWWSAAYALHCSASRRMSLTKAGSKYRSMVQRGLSALRLISGGVPLPLALHLAKCFTAWATTASETGSIPVSEVTALEERAEHYWQKVMTLLKKPGTALNHTPKERLFSISRHELSSSELEAAEEEGRLFLAQRMVKCGRRQEALNTLGQLKGPDAAYQRAMIYKQQAAEVLSAANEDPAQLSLEQKRQHTLLLTQTRDTLYLTLDRLRMPGVDRNHPLNSVLSHELEQVECSLATLGTNTTILTSVAGDASYLGGGGDESVLGGNPHTPMKESALNNSLDTLTPLMDNRSSSIFRRFEARPSPERLDAQVRHLTTVQEQTLQNLSEQNAALRSYNNTLKETCGTMDSQVKESNQLFRSILEQNRSISMDCFNSLRSELKTVLPAIRELQEDVRKIKSDVAEVKALTIKRSEESVPEGPSHAPPAPHPQAAMMPPNFYMGYYGAQAGAPHPHIPPHLMPPPTSMFGGAPHHPSTPTGTTPHGGGFMPPGAGMPGESPYMGPVGGLHLSRLLAASTAANTSSNSAAHHQQQQMLAANTIDQQQQQGTAAQYTTGSNNSGAEMHQTASGRSTSVSSVTGMSAPHQYQIPLPNYLSSVTPPRHHTPERTPTGITSSGVSAIATTGLLANVPPPIYSAVTPESSPLRPPVPHIGVATTAPTHSPLQSIFASSNVGIGPHTPLTGKVKTVSQQQDHRGMQQQLYQDTPSLLNTPSATAASVPANSTLNTGDSSVAKNNTSTSEYYKDDEDHDPCPDFKPVVPLPAEVEVCTGEEEEQVMFEERAKLFRMVSKEWKERGTGALKILHHAVKKSVRILMRRDQTHKICANHSISSNMDLKKQMSSETAWLWAAKDFADEEFKNETFCCRFKTPEIATDFQKAFAEAKQLVAEYESTLKIEGSKLGTGSAVATAGSMDNKQKPLSEMFKKPAGTWDCEVCLVNNSPDAANCIACQTPNPKGGNEGPAVLSSTVKDSSSTALSSFKFGVSSPPSFMVTSSTAAPSKASGSITFGVSGDVSKIGSMFGTSNNGSANASSLYGTPSSVLNKGTLFSPSSTQSMKGGIFSTPVTSNAALADSSTSMFGISNISTKVNVSNTLSDTFSTPTGADNKATGLFGSAAPPPATTSAPSLFSAISTSAPTAPAGKLSFGGFSFTTTPSIVAPTKEKEEKPVVSEPKKESIFSSFTFSGSSATASTPLDFNKAGADPEKKSLDLSKGSLFSNVNNTENLTFGSVNKTTDPSSVFKTKDADAFKPKPLFAASVQKTPDKSKAEESTENVEEYEPEVHFEPVIPLPELIQVKTGEEEEEQLFCDRAKLFRYADATTEWKERGLGDVKILSNNITGKIRILMRREKTLKICANHYITENIKMITKHDAENALTWAAGDFADGELVNETFCIKFKTKEQAMQFKSVVEKAQQTLSAATTQPSSRSEAAPKQASDEKKESLMDKFKPAPGSWECSMCLVRNTPDATACLSCQTLKPGTVAAITTPATPSGSSSELPSLASMFKPAAGSWNCTSCLVQNKPDTTACIACQTAKPGTSDPAAKNSGTAASEAPAFSFGITTSTTASSGTTSTTGSNFTAPAFKFGSSEATASFSFGLPAASKGEGASTGSDAMFPSGPTPSAFKFGSPDKFNFSFKPKSPRSRDVSQCESEDGVVDEDEGDHLYFEPVVPLPDKVDVVTGEEEEEVLYSHRAKLYRKAGPEWKERGLGDVKVLRHKTTDKIRLLMRREQVHKICLNHYVKADMELRNKDEKSFYWVAQDFSEEAPAIETFAIRFKSPEVAAEFKAAITRAQAGDFTVSTFVGESETKEDQPGPELAKKLMLPEDFFNEPSEKCPGCIGCKVDTLPALLPHETPEGNVLKDIIVESVSPTSSSMFSAPSKPLFGSVSSSTSSNNTPTLSFGSAPNVTFAVSSPNLRPSIFAQSSTATTAAANTSSIFGGASIFSKPDSTPTSGTLFSNTESSKGSIFGSVQTSNSTGSIFEPSSSSVTTSAATTTQSSIFGGSATQTTTASIFGAPQSNGSMFGSNSATATTTASIFGGGASIFSTNSVPTTTQSSIFGGSSTATSGSIFGGAANATSGSIFGGTTGTTSGSIFGGTTGTTSGSIFGATPATSSGSIFGGASATSSGSIFGGTSATSGSIFGGTAATTGSIFGSAPTNTGTPKSTENESDSTDKFSKGILSGAGSLTFADVPKTGFSKTTTDASAWEPKPLFANSQKDESKDDSHLSNDDTHDPHFEPVIPLPALVEVKTGEEHLVEYFSFRAKSYRFDNNTKEWKERGLGNIKILVDPATKKFRVLQRREQIHKLAINHYIVSGQKLSPLASSTVAWCWYARDYSDDNSGTDEHFAAKFKTEEVANEFKSKFEECVAVVEDPSTYDAFLLKSGLEIKEVVAGASSGPVETTPTGFEAPHTSVTQDDLYDHETGGEYDEEDASDDEEEDYIDNSVIFERECTLEKRIGEEWVDHGTVVLSILWESDSYCARLMALGDDGDLQLDHLISKNIDCTAQESCAIWGAQDLSQQPASHVKIRATFASEDVADEFANVFNDARDDGTDGEEEDD